MTPFWRLSHQDNDTNNSRGALDMQKREEMTNKVCVWQNATDATRRVNIEVVNW